MKILLIHNYGLFQGGAETYLHSLIFQLKKRGHTVVVYVKDSRKIVSFVDKVNVAIGMIYNHTVARELDQLIRKERPDVAQVLNIYPLITATAYHTLSRYKIPIIQRVQDYRLFCPKATLFRKNSICELCVAKKFKYPSIQYGCYQNSKVASFFFSVSFFFHQIIGTYKRIDRYIFPTDFVRKYYCKHAHIERKKTIIIPTFTDIKGGSGKKREGVQQGDFFLYFGRLSEEKGVLQLLEIFKKLNHIALIMIGDGPLKTTVETYSKYKNIMIKNHLSRQSLVPYIKNAKAVIIPSLWYDVMPNVLMESNAQQTPVIVPNSGVFPELVGKKWPYMYKRGDHKALQAIIVKLSQSKKRIYSINTEFSVDMHMAKLIHLYKTLI